MTIRRIFLAFVATLAAVPEPVDAFTSLSSWGSQPSYLKTRMEAHDDSSKTSEPVGTKVLGDLVQQTIVHDGTGETTTKPTAVRRRFQNFQWNPPASLSTVDGTVHMDASETFNINHRVEGPEDGPPILLVHGFGASVSHFRHQFPALVEKGYRVHAVDLLGFGASDKPGHVPYCIELFVQLLKDYMDAMDRQGSSPWIVAGNSIGGLCSLGVAKSFGPDRVNGVVLFNCAGGMTGFRYEDVPIVLRPILAFVQKVVLGPQLGGRFFRNFKTRENVESILMKQGVYKDTTNVDDELLEILLEPAADEGAEEVFLKTFAGPPGPTPESFLIGLECPILAIWGGADPWTPADKGKHAGTDLSLINDNFELIVLPGVAHCPHDEAPDQVHEHLLPWLQKRRKADAMPKAA